MSRGSKEYMLLLQRCQPLSKSCFSPWEMKVKMALGKLKHKSPGFDGVLVDLISCEYQIDTHHLFINYKQAYDRNSRNELYAAMLKKVVK